MWTRCPLPSSRAASLWRWIVHCPRHRAGMTGGLPRLPPQAASGTNSSTRPKGRMNRDVESGLKVKPKIESANLLFRDLATPPKSIMFSERQTQTTQTPLKLQSSQIFQNKVWSNTNPEYLNLWTQTSSSRNDTKLYGSFTSHFSYGTFPLRPSCPFRPRGTHLPA